MRTENNPFHYHGALFEHAIALKGWTSADAARAAGIDLKSVKGAMAGELKTVTKLRPLADALGIVWVNLFDEKLKVSQFHRACLNRKRVR